MIYIVSVIGCIIDIAVHNNIGIGIRYKTFTFREKKQYRKLLVSYGKYLEKSYISLNFSYHTHGRFFYPYEIVLRQVYFFVHSISKVFLPRIVVDINHLWIEIKKQTSIYQIIRINGRFRKVDPYNVCILTLVNSVQQPDGMRLNSQIANMEKAVFCFPKCHFRFIGWQMAIYLYSTLIIVYIVHSYLILKQYEIFFIPMHITDILKLV